MPKPTCLQLKVQLAEIQSLFREFDLVLVKIRETKKTEHLLEMQKEIEGKIESLQREFVPQEIREKIQDWQDFYREVFQMETDLSKIKIPEKQEGFERLLIMQKGMTAQRLFDKCTELFAAENHMGENWDKDLTSDRNALDHAYAIWVRDNVEVDYGLNHLAADNMAEKGITVETLEERLLEEIKYFKQTEQHLDITSKTMCAGSRSSSGDVPHVHWSSGGDRLIMGKWTAVFRSEGLRARQVIV